MVGYAPARKRLTSGDERRDDRRTDPGDGPQAPGELAVEHPGEVHFGQLDLLLEQVELSDDYRMACRRDGSMVKRGSDAESRS